ncbi:MULTISPECIES: hypothetical protein [Bacillus cereus group]|uniref:Uncharacterized protein n=1 Tax=Bacillus thuringiensis serovar toumanoffi TaxID=180862 RepID=A0ABD5IA52_BACTU|nr:hypothetical protein [Bacillus thuringiensis]EEM92384.1 hypothetical protein bthur0013_63030 [Bacillus thuringiensis IBL 200]MCR6784379.1 hypothetical protein [Bacillus thuringiensis]MCR6863088.1 hypothetical protein [Bacillus thuringiensis]MCR6869304.1 hypothetical protein [Bacillus thuringiensis]MDW9214050.1 hypothetical protein [Bacillus thuringiensis serovar toumanoffi]
MLAVFKNKNVKDDVYLKCGYDSVGKKIKYYPEVKNKLDSFSEEVLFELGYSVLMDAILNIRNLSYGEDTLLGKEFVSWMYFISNDVHNIPGKLKEKEVSHLKEELAQTIMTLYSLKESQIDKSYIVISTTNIDDLLSKYS